MVCANTCSTLGVRYNLYFLSKLAMTSLLFDDDNYNLL